MSVIEEIKQKVHPECIGLAIFVHEFSGLSLMIGAWSFMYILNPTWSLMSRYDKLNSYKNKADQWTHRKMEKLPNLIKNSKRINLSRLATSGVESYLLRNLLRPITIPSKFAFAIWTAKVYADRKYGKNWSHQ